MLAVVTKITLSSCLGFYFQIFLIYTTHRVPRAHPLHTNSQHCVVHADLHYECKKVSRVFGLKYEAIRKSAHATQRIFVISLCACVARGAVA